MTDVIIVALDITERERQAERFQAFVEGSSDIITVLDEAGVVEYVSPSIDRVLGYEPAELIGENPFELVHPMDHDDLIAAFGDLVSADDVSTFTSRYRFRHANGSWRWVESRATMLPGLMEGRYVVNTHDVTEQVEARQKLRRTEESRSLALRAADAGVWEWNPASDELIMDESLEMLFGLVPGTFEGSYRDFASRVHPEDLPEVEAAIQRSLERYEPFQTTFRIIRADGIERWVEGRAKILFDDSGEPDRMLGVIVDVTDNKDRLKQLQVMDRVLRHNLHNDINIVHGYAEMIKDKGPAPIADYAENIVQHSDHLLNLTDKQQKITSVLSSEPTPTEVDLNTVIRRTAETIGTAHPDAEIALDLPDEIIVTATDGIGTAIEELITNAVKHSDVTPPTVEVSAQQAAATVDIRIADAGPGIPDMERRVVVGDREIEPLYHGSGLGLWLVLWIIRRCRGTLKFEENDPRGTVVNITLLRPTTDEDRPGQVGGDSSGV